MARSGSLYQKSNSENESGDSKRCLPFVQSSQPLVMGLVLALLPQGSPGGVEPCPGIVAFHDHRGCQHLDLCVIHIPEHVLAARHFLISKHLYVRRSGPRLSEVVLVLEVGQVDPVVKRA